MRAAIAVVFALLAGGCRGDSGSSLVVDLRTDLIAGVEFFGIRAELVGERTVPEIAALRGQSFLDGRRILEIDGLTPGRRVVRVVLLDADGGLLVEQRVAFDLDGDRGITVLITRDCAPVSCPAAGDAPDLEACLGGVCVPETCVGPEADGCPPPACAVDSECTSVPCAEGRCVRGVCLVGADDGLCASTERCDPRDGCVGDPVGDGGVDGGVDAEVALVSIAAVPADLSIPPGGSTTIDVSVRNDSTTPVSFTVHVSVPRFGSVAEGRSLSCTADVPVPHVEDDFGRPDRTGGLGTTASGESWLNLRGVPLSLVGGHATFADTAYSMANLSQPSGRHGTVAATFVEPGDEAWVVARIRDDSNYIRFGHQVGSGGYELQNIVATGIVPFDSLTTYSAGVAPVPGDRVELSVESDASIVAYVNGRLFFEASLAATVGLGSVGLAGLDRGGAARIDDFSFAPTSLGDTCDHQVVDLAAGVTDDFAMVLTAASPVPVTLRELVVPIVVEDGGRVLGASMATVSLR